MCRSVLRYRYDCQNVEIYIQIFCVSPCVFVLFCFCFVYLVWFGLVFCWWWWFVCRCLFCLLLFLFSCVLLVVVVVSMVIFCPHVLLKQLRYIVSESYVLTLQIDLACSDLKWALWGPLGPHGARNPKGPQITPFCHQMDRHPTIWDF